MAALTADREVPHFLDQQLRGFAVGGAETIYKGSFVSVKSSGYTAPLGAGETFVGLAFEGCDNSAGPDGAKSLRVYTLGDFECPLAGAAMTDIGAPVFAGDDGTLTLTAAGNSYVGKCVDIPASGKIILRLQTLVETSPAYTVTNGTTDRAYDADTVAIARLTDASKWFLLKTDAAIRPFIFQDREPIEFKALEAESETGFMREVFQYGVRAR